MEYTVQLTEMQIFVIKELFKCESSAAAEIVRKSVSSEDCKDLINRLGEAVPSELQNLVEG